MKPGEDKMLRIERLRADAYEQLMANPSGPRADQLRAVLAELPKLRTAASMPSRRRGDDNEQLQLSGKVGNMEAGEMEGDIELPPTRDQELGIDKGLKSPGFGTQAAVTVGSPSGRRELERGLDDSITFGVGQKVAGFFDDAFSPGQEVQDREAAGEGPRMAGQLFGSVMPGATSSVFKTVHTPLSALASRAPGVAGKAVAGAGAGAATMGIASPAIAGAQTAVRGDEGVFSAMKDAATDPVSLGVGAVAGAAGGMAAGIRGSKGQTGRDIRLAEEYGATPTPFGGAKGGIFDTPLMEGMESTSRDAGALASRASKSLHAGLEGERKAIQSEYVAGRGEAEGLGQLEGKVRPDYILDSAKRLLSSESLTAGEKAQIQTEVMDVLSKYPSGIPIMRANELKQKVQRLSQGEGPLVDIAKAAKSSIDETEMGPVNLRYHEGMEGLRDKMGMLRIKPDQDPLVSRDKVARQILNRGENVGGVGIREPEVEQFIAENPRYKTLFDAVSSLNARERMGLTLTPEGGGLLHRVGNIVGHNIEPALVGAYRGGQKLDANALPLSLISKFLLGQQADEIEGEQ